MGPEGYWGSRPRFRSDPRSCHRFSSTTNSAGSNITSARNAAPIAIAARRPKVRVGWKEEGVKIRNMVEKILGANAQINQMMADAYAALKAEHGYSQEAIERKRLSLEGVLVPVTAQWNEELLAMAGFSCVDCFWRWMNFAGWLAVK